MSKATILFLVSGILAKRETDSGTIVIPPAIESSSFDFRHYHGRFCNRVWAEILFNDTSDRWPTIHLSDMLRHKHEQIATFGKSVGFIWFDQYLLFPRHRFSFKKSGDKTL
jgi:hypothetical protein